MKAKPRKPRAPRSPRPPLATYTARLGPVDYSSCLMFSTRPTVCPLCRTEIPAGELHRCEHMRDVNVERLAERKK